MAKRLINGILSAITTCMLMAAPVAAIIYASGPMEISNTRIVTTAAVEQEHEGLAAGLERLGARINAWRPGILDDSIMAMVINIRNSPAKP